MHVSGPASTGCAGDTEDAIREGRQAVDLLPISKDASNGPNIALFMAQAYAMLGQNEAAVRELRIILSAPSLFNERLLAVDPVWDGLRVDATGVRQ